MLAGSEVESLEQLPQVMHGPLPTSDSLVLRDQLLTSRFTILLPRPLY